MNELLDEMELALSDLLQAGLASAVPEAAHRMQKDDQALTDRICRAGRYLALCRQRWQEEAIRLRWQGRS